MKIKMKDGSIQEAGFDEKLGKDAFRHTTAHILAPVSDTHLTLPPTPYV